MQISKLQKGWLIFSAVIIILVFINIIGIIWYFYPNDKVKYHENIFAGRVSGITADFITTIDIHKVTKTFAISSSTKYITGREQIEKDDVNLNDLVIITPDKNVRATTTVASEIRVMKNKDRGMPRK